MNPVLRWLRWKMRSEKRSYPDDYAGMYIDGASLVVMLTVFSDETQAEYRELAGSYAGCLSFREAEYSYETLQNALQAAEQDLKENGMLAPPAPGQTGPTNYVSVPDNCVVVHLRKNVDALKMWFLEWKYERQYGVPLRRIPPAGRLYNRMLTPDIM